VDHTVADGNICVPDFRMFHPPPDTSGDHTSISIHTTKSPTAVCSWTVVLHTKFNHYTLEKRHTTGSHFVTVDCGTLVVSCARSVFMLERVHVAIGIRPRVLMYRAQMRANGLCSWLLVIPSYLLFKFKIPLAHFGFHPFVFAFGYSLSFLLTAWVDINFTTQQLVIFETKSTNVSSARTNTLGTEVFRRRGKSVLQIWNICRGLPFTENYVVVKRCCTCVFFW
jgi:hypothetical protein